MRESTQERYKLLKILGCIGFIPLVPIIFTLLLPYMMVANRVVSYRENVLFRQLRARGRVMSWKEVADRLDRGDWTLIIEQKNKWPVRYWWTPDDLLTLAPMPVPSFEDVGFDYIGGKSKDPFVLWCLSNYVSFKTGKAFLTRLEKLKVPRGPVEAEFFQGLFPKAKIVMTVLVREKE